MRRWAVLALLVAGTASSCAFTQRPELAVGRPEAQSSRVYAADGTLVATLHGEEDREVVPFADIPETLQQAVVAVEDERFWQHRGVDLRAVVRAAYANAQQGRLAEGGSTITQQYVKNVLLAREKTARRKLREAAVAYQLEKRYTKARILELYLNSIYFGNGAYGVQAASEEYFGIAAKKLDLAQSALLAGVIHAPNATDPYAYPDRAAARRRTVLSHMVDQHLISRAEADAAAAAPLRLRDRSGDDRYPAPYFVERVKRFVLDDSRFGATAGARRELLFRGGLRIETTLDLDRQTQAEDALAKVLSVPGKDPAGAVVSIEPRSGRVQALVGGRDFFGAGREAKFDLATQGRRPAGSSFKPFVLAAALRKGIPLSRTYPAPSKLVLRPKTGVWNVDNYEGEGGGSMDLVEATVHSVNTVYAQLILDVGPDEAVELATDMGIRSPLKPLPSAVLGTNDVSPFEMAAAYGTFANRGLRVDPFFVSRVIGADGGLLYEHHHAQRRVLPSAIVDTEVPVLRQVVDRGTAVNARLGRPVAGKTGTGQAWRDAWFVGFTPELVTSVWVGFPERQRSMVPPATRIRVTGGSWPAQIWQLYMSKALADVPASFFPAPPAAPATTVPSSTSSTVPGGSVTVPNVVGEPIDAAIEDLRRAGLGVQRRDGPNDQYPPGYVFAQTPGGGTAARAGAVVVVHVSDGTAQVAVPDVLEMNEADAKAKIGDAGLEVKVVREPEPQSSTSGSRTGLVWRQSPQGGTRVAARSTVTIWVNPPSSSG